MLVLDSTSRSSIPLFDYFLHAYLYMRPNFNFWSKVKTTYSNNYDDDNELGDLDDDELGDVDADHVEIDINSDDDLEYSLNKMSITPHRSFYHPMTMNNATGLSMPAKIRPSLHSPAAAPANASVGRQARLRPRVSRPHPCLPPLAAALTSTHACLRRPSRSPPPVLASANAALAGSRAYVCLRRPPCWTPPPSRAAHEARVD
ncbi:hypothetical protein PR202_ga14559 [Eleusine coracana subsp. coracana]|uniref:Uncharacterized protein n=1 Tax=Eleusine coracana subsp. coracana TaxID=191504 RepID=A0AAV5CHW5_ELECO|nr:hypothetical protein PR202_ga14559 [Eleusine coracana subsp. coracana]